jgi:hypothetical protein
MLSALRSFLSNLWFRITSRNRSRSSNRIFAYFDGQAWRSIDPISVIYALENHPEFSAEKHLKAAHEGNRQAIETIANTVCDVFGVQPYCDGIGLTIAERKALLDTFCLYCEAVKKNT